MIFIFPLSGSLALGFLGFWYNHLNQPPKKNHPKKQKKKPKSTAPVTREAALSYQSLQWRVLGASRREAIRWLAGDGDLEGLVSRGTNLEAGYINLSQVERWWKWHFLILFGSIYIGVFFPLANGIRVFLMIFAAVFSFPLLWLLVIFQRPWCDLPWLSPPLACDQDFFQIVQAGTSKIGIPWENLPSIFVTFSKRKKKNPGMMYICIKRPIKKLG